MEERDRVVWLHRSGGFGLPAAQLQAAVDAGAEAELQRLLDPDGAGGPPSVDPWDDTLLPLDPMDREARIHAVGAWLRQMIETGQPALDRMAWWWHGHLVSGLDKVRFARAMVEQVRLFRRDGLGSFPALLRSITLDPAMLLYLDLHTSTGRQPNENYARELLELFALGVGEYEEADVKAAATALTGWVLQRTGDVQFAPLRHDDDPQELLGASGVHNLDTVLSAVVAHPAMPGFLARSLAEEVLGTTDETVTGRIADAFAASGFDCRELLRATLQEGIDGHAEPVVLAPVPWFAQSMRVCEAGLRPQADAGALAQYLRDAGQLPMLPPNVAGWPGGSSWFGSGALIARANLASLVARRASSAVVDAARSDDPAVLAEVLGLPAAGFGDESAAALLAAPRGTERLGVALVTPEFMIVEAPR
ncbi:MAG: DUF1800 family protein [Acidimicrobiaceae bacterium]|nr:DUF1800 family protein [Ilumatobacter sp.]MCB9379481.1 DUF1800 family protein [Acidimicrobiaceae bacterium]MCO5332046.1 DUF1800 domain-containing protein [Ilumatobacteraceae bacterium]